MGQNTPSSIDVALARRPRLQVMIRRLAVDPGVTIDQIVGELVARGVLPPKADDALTHPKRSAVARWRAHVRQAAEGGAFSPVVIEIVARVLAMKPADQKRLLESLKKSLPDARRRVRTASAGVEVVRVRKSLRHAARGGKGRAA